eukprot:m.76998 g.76998  ORF g.76998 m.76998 type:complete len:956 (-) comp8126_c0_seq2:2154-5021(-)
MSAPTAGSSSLRGLLRDPQFSSFFNAFLELPVFETRLRYYPRCEGIIDETDILPHQLNRCRSASFPELGPQEMLFQWIEAYHLPLFRDSDIHLELQFVRKICSTCKAESRAEVSAALETYSQFQDFLGYLWRSPGLHLYELWIDVERTKRWEGSARADRVRDMRGKYIRQGGLLHSSPDMLGLTPRSEFPDFARAQSLALKKLLEYWVPRFTGKRPSSRGSSRSTTSNSSRPISSGRPVSRGVSSALEREDPHSNLPSFLSDYSPTRTRKHLNVFGGTAEFKELKHSAQSRRAANHGQSSLQSRTATSFASGSSALQLRPVEQRPVDISETSAKLLADLENRICYEPSCGYPFRAFLQRVCTTERILDEFYINLYLFCVDIEEFRNNPQTDPASIQLAASAIYQNFVGPRAVYDIGLAAHAREVLCDQLQAPTRNMYNFVEQQILYLLTDVWAWYLAEQRATFAESIAGDPDSLLLGDFLKELMEMDENESIEDIFVSYTSNRASFHASYMAAMTSTISVSDLERQRESVSFKRMSSSAVDPDLPTLEEAVEGIVVPSMNPEVRDSPGLSDGGDVDLPAALDYLLDDVPEEVPLFQAFLERRGGLPDAYAWADMETFLRSSSKAPQRIGTIYRRNKKVIDECIAEAPDANTTINAKTFEAIQPRLEQRFAARYVPEFKSSPMYEARAAKRRALLSNPIAEHGSDEQVALLARAAKVESLAKRGSMTGDVHRFYLTVKSKENQEYFREFLAQLAKTSKDPLAHYLPMDFEFWLDVQRFKLVCHDFGSKELMADKLKSMISRFFNSELGQPVTVSIPEDMARKIVSRAKNTTFVSPYVFREVEAIIAASLADHLQAFFRFLKSGRAKRRGRAFDRIAALAQPRNRGPEQPAVVKSKKKKNPKATKPEGNLCSTLSFSLITGISMKLESPPASTLPSPKSIRRRGRDRSESPMLPLLE